VLRIYLKSIHTFKKYNMIHTLGQLLKDVFSLYPMLISAVAGLSIGFALRVYINNRQKKAMLKLENKMLGNHAQILYLESKLNKMQKMSRDLADTSHKKSALKAS